MHSFKKDTFLTNNAIEIYRLITDIKSYPDFVPWCEDIEIISVDEQQTIAEMKINYKGFTDKYRSRISQKQEGDNYVVTVEAISGPFKYLNNVWCIENLEQGCHVSFAIDLEFKSFLLDKMVGLLFVKTTERMIEAFLQRANSLSHNKI
ncbi:MAG: type II toxin-antitoxin system RatA family toxin [Rickettsiaceae bacterium]|nr:MAG: type II toxin-antitoxin system RatA family toxin [Rickettsiaceae bacterium]